MAVTAAIASTILASCSTSASPTSDAARVASLKTALNQLVTTSGGPPGAIAIVQTGSGIRVVTAGVGDLSANRAIATDDTFRLASVSKAYSGAVALSLVSRKVLALSDTIGNRLPNLPRAWAAVTLAEVLQHTSGLPDYIKNQAFLTALQANPHMALSPEQLLGYVSSEPLSFAPGSRYEYSDSDNIVVGLMVQAATDTDYSAELGQQVLTPLQLTHTALPTTVDMPAPYVRGYDVTPGKPPDDVSTAINPALAWASGGMISTPSELNEFMRAYVAGKLFDRSTRNDQLQFVTGSSGPPGPGTNSAGLGIFRYQTNCGTVFGHTGNIPGYTVFAAASANGSRSVVVVVNTQLNSSPMTPAFTRLRDAEGLGVCAAMG
jgi:D-alanyl-D-alanine carboxypeptidase